MEPVERQELEERLKKINDRLGLLNPKQLGADPPEEMDAGELHALYQERERIMKKLGLV